MAQRWILLLLMACVASAAWAVNPAQPLERLVMPGELVRAHAQYEQDCTACHVRFKKGGQSDKCRACHEAIDADLRQRQGFHGRNPAAAEQECRHCHTDHRGRDARIVLFDPDAFDHRHTDFPLEGAHRAAGCGDCHRPGEPHRDAPSACERCHQDDDWHMGRLPRCGQCHGTARWGAWRFDHRRTGYRLEGAHADVPCEACHANARYPDTPEACIDCHRLDDVHEGKNGKDCQDCHDLVQWTRPAFDHDRDTDYPLEGRHAAVPCQACHGDDVHAPLQTDCHHCHRREDAHNGLYGEACQDCHLPKAWVRTTFDHDRDTDYRLQGAHRGLACGLCHRGALDEPLPRDCFGCHQEDDLHAGEQGQRCQDCHDPRAWVHPVIFDHDLTDFPLLGLHRVVPCEACHLSPEFAAAPSRCQRCHERDDERAHGGRLGEDCALCHTANGWTLWTFDHDRQTDYPLTGAHADLDCHACHTQPVEGDIRLPHDCIGCHEDDDAHNGAFGNRCQRCHVTADWREVKVR